MPDQKSVLQEYVELKRVVKEAEEKIKELGGIIKGFSEVDDVYELEDAKVSLVQGKPSYVYSDDLTMREAELKESKTIEVQTGVATVKYGSPFLMVKLK